MAHVHGGGSPEKIMGISALLTTLFVIGEAAAGYFSNSLALLSDAGHNFADLLAYFFPGTEFAPANGPPTVDAPSATIAPAFSPHW